jgi:molybdate transport system substrate-binding protein
VDVFASADEATMAAVEAAGEVAAHPRTFARNHLVLAVPPGNPGSVKGLEDLAREELWVGLCAPEVPCGRYARAVLERAGVKPALDTEEADVRALLTRVALGELDVAVTYATDVAAAGGQAEAIVIPDSVNVVAELPVAVLAAAPNPAAARSFVDLLTSAPGRRVLARHGFALP